MQSASDYWDTPFEAKRNGDEGLVVTCQRWPFLGFDSDEAPSVDQIAGTDFGSDVTRLVAHLAATSWRTKLWLALFRHFRDSAKATLGEAYVWPVWILRDAETHFERAVGPLARYKGPRFAYDLKNRLTGVRQALRGLRHFAWTDVEERVLSRLGKGVRVEVELEGFLKDVHDVVRELMPAAEHARAASCGRLIENSIRLSAPPLRVRREG